MELFNNVVRWSMGSFSLVFDSNEEVVVPYLETTAEKLHDDYGGDLVEKGSLTGSGVIPRRKGVWTIDGRIVVLGKVAYLIFGRGGYLTALPVSIGRGCIDKCSPVLSGESDVMLRIDMYPWDSYLEMLWYGVRPRLFRGNFRSGDGQWLPVNVGIGVFESSDGVSLYPLVLEFLRCLSEVF